MEGDLKCKQTTQIFCFRSVKKAYVAQQIPSPKLLFSIVNQNKFVPPGSRIPGGPAAPPPPDPASRILPIAGVGGRPPDVGEGGGPGGAVPRGPPHAPPPPLPGGCQLRPGRGYGPRLLIRLRSRDSVWVYFGIIFLACFGFVVFFFLYLNVTPHELYLALPSRSWPPARPFFGINNFRFVFLMI